MTDADRDYILITVAKYLAQGEPVDPASNIYKMRVPYDVESRLNSIIKDYESEAKA